MENLRPKKLYSTARRIFCCKKPKKTLDDYLDKAWRRPSFWDIDEDNVEPIRGKTEYIEPFQIKGYACEALLTDHSLLTCAGVRYELEGTCIKRYGKCQYYNLAAPNGGVDTVYNHFPECYSHARIILEMLLRFSRQRPIALMDIYLLNDEEAERIAEEWDKIDPYFPKIPVKKLIMGNKNFGMERFFDFEYLSLRRGAQLYPEINTAKFLVVSDKQEDLEEIKRFKGWGLVVMEAEENQFPPTILKGQVTEWLETGNCQYKFLCILDEKRDIIEDSIIKWALSLEGEPVPENFGEMANLKKRLIHGEEEGIIYIFKRNCIVFMRGDAICDEFGHLLALGSPRSKNLFHRFFIDLHEKPVPFNENMFS